MPTYIYVYHKHEPDKSDKIHITIQIKKIYTHIYDYNNNKKLTK